jgi:hypothetical protein
LRCISPRYVLGTERTNNSTYLITASAIALAALPQWLLSPREPKPDVRFWHKADVTSVLSHVRFRGQSRHRTNLRECPPLTPSRHVCGPVALIRWEEQNGKIVCPISPNRRRTDRLLYGGNDQEGVE